LKKIFHDWQLLLVIVAVLLTISAEHAAQNNPAYLLNTTCVYKNCHPNVSIEPACVLQEAFAWGYCAHCDPFEEKELIP